MGKIKDLIVDKYLTWRTGHNKATREYYAWRQGNIVPNASYVGNYYQGFKHILALDYNKVHTSFDPLFGHIPSADFLSYMYPNRTLGNHCEYGIFRGMWDQWDYQFHITDFGDRDQLFVATNSNEDAIMLTLKYA